MAALRRPFSRRFFLALAAAGMVFALYVSVLPFEFRGWSVDAALDRYAAILRAPRPGRVPRTNYVANALMFVPIGFGLGGALLADRRRRLLLPAMPIVLGVGLAVSFVIEFLQLFVPGRIPARTDIEAQTIGCAAGILLWGAVGPALTAGLRATMPAEPDDRLGRVLVAYGSIWTFVNLAPFDLTLDPGELAGRVRTGMITLVPFGGAASTPRLVWDAVATFVAAAPLGAMALIAWTGARRRRSSRSALLLAATLVAAVEAAQIVIRSHAADTGDLLVGWGGVVVGVGLARRTFASGRRAAAPRGAG